ncbi:MAG: hypothetical protein D6806_16945 [Deltaproteobacteria bacterium]|nr:MAG: hypothetical protein D6806_16945 [Deltaproteobacteria bacterium]
MAMCTELMERYRSSVAEALTAAGIDADKLLRGREDVDELFLSRCMVRPVEVIRCMVSRPSLAGAEMACQPGLSLRPQVFLGPPRWEAVAEQRPLPARAMRRRLRALAGRWRSRDGGGAWRIWEIARSGEVVEKWFGPGGQRRTVHFKIVPARGRYALLEHGEGRRQLWTIALLGRKKFLAAPAEPARMWNWNRKRGLVARLAGCWLRAGAKSCTVVEPDGNRIECKVTQRSKKPFKSFDVAWTGHGRTGKELEYRFGFLRIGRRLVIERRLWSSGLFERL